MSDHVNGVGIACIVWEFAGIIFAAGRYRMTDPTAQSVQGTNFADIESADTITRSSSASDITDEAIVSG